MRTARWRTSGEYLFFFDIAPYLSRNGASCKSGAIHTRVASIFLNEQALLRLASALPVEINDEWQTGKIYLNMKSEKPKYTTVKVDSRAGLLSIDLVGFVSPV